MGRCTAAEFFQECMGWLLGDVKGVRIALDDRLIASKTYEEAVESLTECLDRIRDSGMTLNYGKCIFIQPNLLFSE